MTASLDIIYLKKYKRSRLGRLSTLRVDRSHVGQFLSVHVETGKR